VLGEWGGKCDTENDKGWHQRIVRFLKDKNLVDQFYW
jgi:hypothetical protein